MAALAACVLVMAASASLAARSLDVAVGKALFERIWTVAGASNQASDGLGPLFNARACASCHPGGGGGQLPGEGGSGSAGLVLRLPAHSPLGRQLQTQAVPGQRVEGELELAWRTETRRLADGTVVELRAPAWRVTQDGAGMAHGSLRLAPDLAGLGWVEAALRGSGLRPFGLKGSHASLKAQVEEALLLDLGLSTTARPEAWGDCTAAQAECRAAPQGAEQEAELSDEVVDALASYVRALPPPPPLAPPDPQGLARFDAAGCAACHQPQAGGLAAYSDFRSHDLGDGLADDDPDDPDRKRWRTTPLWGLGTRLQNNLPLLHDGRARDAMEAILWHGGEASMSVANVTSMPAADRDRLLDFLKGL
jgi:CxxC motif-containing protein (DUF1111 family)